MSGLMMIKGSVRMDYVIERNRTAIELTYNEFWNPEGPLVMGADPGTSSEELVRDLLDEIALYRLGADDVCLHRVYDSFSPDAIDAFENFLKWYNSINKV